MSRELTNLPDHENAYKVKYYRTEECEEIREDVIIAQTVKEAAVYAEQIAESAVHVLGVSEIGLAYVPKKFQNGKDEANG